MSGDAYLWGVLSRESVDISSTSPVRSVRQTLMPALQEWAGNLLLSVDPSGSFAKGTANRSGTDIDLFISLSQDTTESLADIYNTLFRTMQGYSPKRQNVSINVRVGSFDVDLVPGKRQNAYSQDHSLYKHKTGGWTKTNVQEHIQYVTAGRRTAETRILKLWRSQKGLEFPSFYLELVAIEALRGKNGTLEQNTITCLRYLYDRIQSARFVDPANTANIISDDLTAAEKASISSAAKRALEAKFWAEVVV